MYLEHLLICSFFIASISGSALQGNCISNEDCGTIDTHCHEGKCVCKPNFSEWFDSCIQLASPNIPCRKKEGCQHILGPRSLCTRKLQCACRPFHHLHNGQCVKNRDLHDICEHDHQCYCGADCQDKIACIGRNCTCKPGHRAYRSRRCIELFPVHSTSSGYKSESCVLFVSLLIFIRLYL